MNLLLLLSLLQLISPSIKNENILLTVNIENIHSDQGQLIVSLHDTALDFPKKPKIRKFVKIINGSSSVQFRLNKIGFYAITVLHDLNKNNKIDFNFLHIPKEKTVTSNNAKGFLGPPKFKDAKFIINNDMFINLKFSR